MTLFLFFLFCICNFKINENRPKKVPITYGHIIHLFLHACVDFSLHNSFDVQKTLYMLRFVMVFPPRDRFLFIFEESKQRNNRKRHLEKFV